MKNTKEQLAFDVQELDRRRIARDLHDTSLQNLAHLVHKLELASLYVDKDVIQAKLEIASISKSINGIIDEIRNIIYDLRPMLYDDLGLKESLEEIFDKAKEEFDFTILSDIDDLQLEDDTVGLMLLRIIQECVTNACKHSNGTMIQITLKQNENKIFLSIADNGVGFDPEDVKTKTRHFGLLIVEERVKAMSGTVEVRSVPGQGTEISIQIPLFDMDAN